MEVFERLAGCLGRLPGVGRRSAERMALRLARDPDGLARELAESLAAARAALASCGQCGSLTPREEQPCRLCVDPGRDGATLCVVEDPNDIAQIEKSGAFRGRYHALMGKLSPARGEGFRRLRVQQVVERVAREGFREVLLATSTDVEGDATAAHMAERLRESGVKITRLALGLPVSSGVAYSDPVTLQRAIAGRTPF
jgi:recombination protein RecR